MREKWTLSKIPPEGHPDVAEYANDLFILAETEKNRLQKNENFLYNYNLYRGKHQTTRLGILKNLPVNLYFANIERTVANITARRPQGEVVDLDGSTDDGEKILSKALTRWWKKTNQQEKTIYFARMMETYGIGIEKPYWDKTKERPETMLTDPFAFFPAPGYWKNIAEDAPFICFAYPALIYKVEQDYGVDGVKTEDAYVLLGAEREESQGYIRGSISGIRGGRVNLGKQTYDAKTKTCLVKELWIRDKSEKTITETVPTIDDNGEIVSEKLSRTEQVYPDGIRKIMFVLGEDGYKTLDDSANPNINPELNIDLAKTTYPWGKLPVYKRNSYDDLVSIWGFAASEQVGDLLLDINMIINRMKAYVLNVLTPPLIIQKNCGITKADITSQLESVGRLILMPEVPNARIEFMQVPNLPSNFFDVLNLLIKYFDRIYAVEEADRGEAPSGVIAASAIMALQERNQIVMAAKTTSIEMLSVEKSRWAIGLYQNFGTKIDSVDVDGESQQFIGTDFAGRNFSYVIESGSTAPRTSLQQTENVKWLWETKAIDRQATLEILGVDNWQDIIERTAETELGQALQILIQAGLPEDQAMQLHQYLMQPEQGSDGKGENK